MKFLVVNALLAASSVQGYLLPPKTKRIDWKHEQKRQIVGIVTSLLGMYINFGFRTKLI